ncbi:MAG: SAM-dependent methyltransferase [Cyanobacteria bacterium K_Offshore_surface_m2_239]|nr:SAM-dependent methyltransferase [Cyanobacteria bacterium K_Offshore_surface_m2_239]
MADEVGTELVVRTGADGSFSLWSAAFQEGFHSGRGALREARETFLAPSRLERFPPGSLVRVVEVCAGTGGNVALLLEACAARGLTLEWWGLELDRRPLALALASEAFRRPWQPSTLTALSELLARGHWHGEGATARLLWGDARQTMRDLPRALPGPVDLVWHDAFSPRRCPQLWTLEHLQATTAPLAPEGRWISYSAAAAVRDSLRQLGLHLVALEVAAPGEHPTGRTLWSGGTVASPSPLASDSPAGDRPAAQSLWRELSLMEREHLRSAAGEPYRDPDGTDDAATILARRSQAQRAALASGARGCSGAWRRRWGVERR